MLRLAILAILAILQGAILTRAAGSAVLIGCTTSAAASAAIPQLGTYASANVCASACFQQGLFNSLYNSTNCYCANAPPDQGLLVSGQETLLGGTDTQTCSVSGLSAYAYSTLSFAGCATQGLINSVLNTASNFLGTFANPNGCFNAVANLNAQLGVTASALLTRTSLSGGASAGVNTYFCYRASTSGLTNLVNTCTLLGNLSNNRLYSFPATLTTIPGPGGSQYFKRQEAARKRAAMFQPKTLCPADLKPCRIGPNSAHYECMDTQNDLESCGGCLYGEMENLSAPVGTDCSALAGAKLGAATCTAGKCQVSACRPGWKLAPVSDSCRPTTPPKNRR